MLRVHPFAPAAPNVAHGLYCANVSTSLDKVSELEKMFSVKQKLYSVVPIFRSNGQAAVLQVLRFATGGLSISEMADRTELAVSAVHTEVERLDAAGITRSERVGRTRLVSLDSTSPVAGEIAGLIDKLLGVETLLTRALEPLDGIDQVLIFGSWASRRQGVAGPEPADIDLLVIGDMVATDVYDALKPVEAIVGRPINPVLRTAQEWRDDESGFARSIRAGDIMVLIDRTDHG